jgi:hypothetical protein
MRRRHSSDGFLQAVLPCKKNIIAYDSDYSDYDYITKLYGFPLYDHYYHTVGSTSLTWLRALKVLKGARQDACGVKMNLLLNQFNTVQHQFDLVSICGGNHAPTPSQLDQVPLETLRQPQQHRSFGAPETFATVYTVYTVYCVCVYGANARHLDIFHSESCFMFHLVSVSCVNSATLSFL